MFFNACPTGQSLYEECTAAGGAGVLGSYRELMDAMWRGDKRILKPDRLAVSCYAVEYRDIEYGDIEYRDNTVQGQSIGT